jgi:magnesium transporter
MLTRYWWSDERRTLEPVPDTVGEEAVGCWVKLNEPTADELDRAARIAGVPVSVMMHVLDGEEPSRLEMNDDWVFMALQMPVETAPRTFVTYPMALIATRHHFITVSPHNHQILFKSHLSHIRPYDPAKRARMIFLCIYVTARCYLNALDRVIEELDTLEEKLKTSRQADLIFPLLMLQKSLLVFDNALEDHQQLSGLLLALCQKGRMGDILAYDPDDDEDLIMEVMTKNSLIMKRVERHRALLDSLTATSSAIISNNLSDVVKRLTSITVLLAVPTLVASFWGMNTPVPGQEVKGWFYGILVGSLALTGLAAWQLRRRDLL